jgi:hypothetical protein
MKKTFIEPSVSDDFCKAIGRVLVNFSLLEFTIGTVVAGLAQGSASGKFDSWPLEGVEGEEAKVVGEILTSGSSFKRNIEMLCCLDQLRCPKVDKKTFDELVKKLFHLEEERNKIVHSVWGTLPDGNAERYKVAVRSKGHKVSRDKVSLTELHSLSKEIAAACGSLMPIMFGMDPNTIVSVTSTRSKE